MITICREVHSYAIHAPVAGSTSDKFATRAEALVVYGNLLLTDEPVWVAYHTDGRVCEDEGERQEMLSL